MKSGSSNAVRWCNDDKGGPWNLKFQLNYIRNARKKNGWIYLLLIKGEAPMYLPALWQNKA